MNHIFISYSRQNNDYASALANRLLAEGFDVWIDDRIDYGDDWWQTIVKAIRECAAFVVIMSPDSDESRWVQREVTIADELRKPTYPLLLAGDVINSKNWMIYVRTQYIDVTDGSQPHAAFYDDLARHAPRAPQPGHLVTQDEGAAVNEPAPIVIALSAPVTTALSVPAAIPRAAQGRVRAAAIIGALLVIVVLIVLLTRTDPPAVVTAPTLTPSPSMSPTSAPITPTATSSATPTPIPTSGAQSALYPAPLANYDLVRAFRLTEPVNLGWSLAADTGEPVRAGPNGGEVNWTLVCTNCTPEQPSTISQGLALNDASVFGDIGWGFGYGTLTVIIYDDQQLPIATKNRIAAAFDTNDAPIYVHCLYAHLAEIRTAESEILEPDQIFATVGSTGAATGSFLHLECRWSAQRSDVTWTQLSANVFDPAWLFTLEPA